MTERLKIAIVSAACCMPGMAALDKEARTRIDKAVSETKASADVEVIPATKAYFGVGVSRGVLNQAITDYKKSGVISLPAIMINGKVVSYGVPKIEALRSALLDAMAASRKSKHISKIDIFKHSVPNSKLE